MTDFITKEAAKGAINHNYPGFWEAIDAMPAADVAEVVRCKYCRYLGKALGKGRYSCDDYNLPYCEPDSFCSFGKRREE